MRCAVGRRDLAQPSLPRDALRRRSRARSGDLNCAAGGSAADDECNRELLCDEPDLTFPLHTRTGRSHLLLSNQRNVDANEVRRTLSTTRFDVITANYFLPMEESFC